MVKVDFEMFNILSSKSLLFTLLFLARVSCSFNTLVEKQISYSQKYSNIME